MHIEILTKAVSEYHGAWYDCILTDQLEAGGGSTIRWNGVTLGLPALPYSLRTAWQASQFLDALQRCLLLSSRPFSAAPGKTASASVPITFHYCTPGFRIHFCCIWKMPPLHTPTLRVHELWSEVSLEPQAGVDIWSVPWVTTKLNWCRVLLQRLLLGRTQTESSKPN